MPSHQGQGFRSPQGEEKTLPSGRSVSLDYSHLLPLPFPLLLLVPLRPLPPLTALIFRVLLIPFATFPRQRGWKEGVEILRGVWFIYLDRTRDCLLRDSVHFRLGCIFSRARVRERGREFLARMEFPLTPRVGEAIQGRGLRRAPPIPRGLLRASFDGNGGGALAIFRIVENNFWCCFQ